MGNNGRWDGSYLGERQGSLKCGGFHIG
jgi:hypothetical protein